MAHRNSTSVLRSELCKGVTWVSSEYSVKLSDYLLMYPAPIHNISYFRIHVYISGDMVRSDMMPLKEQNSWPLSDKARIALLDNLICSTAGRNRLPQQKLPGFQLRCPRWCSRTRSRGSKGRE